jgi:RNA polymerase sigma-70 factor (ECF subfamily)
MTGRGSESAEASALIERQLTQADISARIAQEYPGLRRLILRKIGDVSIAEEILNEAICITWKKWQDGKLAEPAKITGFVLGVAMNVWNNRRRTADDRADRRVNPQLLESLAAHDTPQDEAFDTRMACIVRDIIKSMDTQRDRVVLVRFYLNEEDKQTICDDMGFSSSQFLKVLHRARSRLRLLMEEQGLKRSDFLGELLC